MIKPNKSVRMLSVLLLLGGIISCFAAIGSAQEQPEQRILFFLLPDRTMYSVKHDGTELEVLAVHPDSPQESFLALADISPDGQTLAYGDCYTPCDLPGCYPSRINLLDLTTGEIRVLTNGDQDVFPLWSPDGRYIAYYTQQTFPFAAVVDVATGEMVLDIGVDLLLPIGDGSAGYLVGMDWSPDSERLVVSINNPPDGGASLYLVNLAGEITLINPAIRGSRPTWQPNSELIYYICGSLLLCRVDVSTNEWEIVPNLSEQLELLSEEDSDISSVDINESGELLIGFAHLVDDGQDVYYVYDLYSYNLNTNVLVKLTNNILVVSPRWYTPATPAMVNDTSSDTPAPHSVVIGSLRVSGAGRLMLRNVSLNP